MTNTVELHPQELLTFERSDLESMKIFNPKKTENKKDEVRIRKDL